MRPRWSELIRWQALQILKGRGLSVRSHAARLRNRGPRRFHAGIMRYPDGGSLSAHGRARREEVRLQAAQMSGQDPQPVQVAHRLWVSTKSAYQWRRRRPAGGEATLASQGPGGAVCKLSQPQLAGCARTGRGPGRARLD